MPPPSTHSEKAHVSTPKFPQKKTVACRPCHARKIRCSGNKPCNNCARASDCVYPTRDRQVRVHQSFLDRILHENAELRARQNQIEPSPNKPAGVARHHLPTTEYEQDSVENQPILEESDWFTHIRTSETPIWIGEISDGAFATRFRQFASFSQVPSHIPRTQFASDDALGGLAMARPAWPSLSRARLLIETALQFLKHNYHIVRRSEVFSTLRTGGFEQATLGVQARMWALFAIGELRSSKCLSATGSLPGLAYFAIASEDIRMINERPHVDVIETVLILPSNSSALNSEDFGDQLHFVASMRLARIAGHISRSLYVRTPQRDTFLQQVEQILGELSQWKEALPSHLKPDFDLSSSIERQPQPVTLLHLSFNQLLIVATRPVLLYVFRLAVNERVATATEITFPDHTKDVVDACIRTARQSCDLLSQCWVNGAFHVFDYFYVQHLFSAAVILAISGTLGRETSQDENDEFNLAAGFIQQLEQNGNFAAMEFYSHIEGIQLTLRTLRASNSLPTALSTSENLELQIPTSLLHPPSGEKNLAISDTIDAIHSQQNVDEVGLDLSFIDDWIYEDALEKLCW